MRLQSSVSAVKPLFRFPFQDKQSRERFMIGTGILLAGFVVPIIPGSIVYGYILRILRSTAQGEAPSMEPWGDWPRLLNLGLRGTVVNLVFILPALVVFLIGLVAYFGTFFLIPLSSGQETDPTLVLFPVLLVAMGTMFFSIGVGTLLLILGLIPLPASLSHFVARDQLTAAFRVREWWPNLSANWLGYLISYVIVVGMVAIMNFVFLSLYYTVVLACVGFLLLIPVSLYSFLVGAALFGDAYQEGVTALTRSQ